LLVRVYYFGVTNCGKGGFDFIGQHYERGIVCELNSTCYVKEYF